MPWKLTAARSLSASPPCARAEIAAAVQARTGAILIHPYDNDRIIAGQGTAAAELLEEMPDLDMIIAPVSGGGLLSGTAIASKGMKPRYEFWARNRRTPTMPTDL